jgi:uncharacterized damage-inducible protein DinB
MTNAFSEMLRHNAWANRAVLDGLVARPEIGAALAYDGKPLCDRAQHLAGTERAFLDVLVGEPKWPQPPAEPAGLIAYAAETDAGLAAIVGGGEAALERVVTIPWFRRELAVWEALAQVLAHSGQHRAELAWELARGGYDTKEIDFIVWRLGGQPAPGEPART